MSFVAPLRDPRAMLEAIYDVRPPTDGWLRRILRKMAPDVDGGLGLYALILDFARDEMPFLAAPVFHRPSDDVRRLGPGLSHKSPAPVRQHFRSRPVEFGSVSQIFGASAIEPVRAQGLPFVDSIGLSVRDGEGTGLQIISPTRDVVRVHGHSRAAWRKIGLHLGTAWRLRRRLERGEEPEAVLHDGRVIEARGCAKQRTARDRLIEATARMERARTSKTRADPTEVLELWRGLVSGRWSLVDHWDKVGRRYVAAYENRIDEAGANRGFSAREVRVLEMYLEGATARDVATALEVSHATAQRVLSSVARRLGLRSRAELERLCEPRLASRLAVHLGDDRVDVLRLDDGALPDDWHTKLTPAQLEVASAAARGLSDGDIARERGTSVRTVSNLLAAAYRALDIRGRRDLVRRAATLGSGTF